MKKKPLARPKCGSENAAQTTAAAGRACGGCCAHNGGGRWCFCRRQYIHIFTYICAYIWCIYVGSSRQGAGREAQGSCVWWFNFVVVVVVAVTYVPAYVLIVHTAPPPRTYRIQQIYIARGKQGNKQRRHVCTYMPCILYTHTAASDFAAGWLAGGWQILQVNQRQQRALAGRHRRLFCLVLSWVLCCVVAAARKIPSEIVRLSCFLLLCV